MKKNALLNSKGYSLFAPVYFAHNVLTKPNLDTVLAPRAILTILLVYLLQILISSNTPLPSFLSSLLIDPHNIHITCLDRYLDMPVRFYPFFL